MHYVSISKDTYFSNTLDNMPRNCSTFAGLTNHANNDHEVYVVQCIPIISIGRNYKKKH